MVSARLSPKQQAFVREYVKDWNGTQAAIRAGYAPGAAHVAATRLISNDKIQEAMRKAAMKIAERAEITAADVVAMWQREANAGDLTLPNSARVKAQDSMAKYLGMFSDKVTGQNIGAGPPIINIQFGVKVDNQLTDSPMPDRLTTHEQEAEDGE